MTTADVEGAAEEFWGGLVAFKESRVGFFLRDFGALARLAVWVSVVDAATYILRVVCVVALVIVGVEGCESGEDGGFV